MLPQTSHLRLPNLVDYCRINVKLGGINTVPDPRSVPFLTDPNQPTIVMGADVIHPAPGSEGRPSFTSLVANVDSDTAKYVAATRVQTSRQEMIEDLEAMAFVRLLEVHDAHADYYMVTRICLRSTPDTVVWSRRKRIRPLVASFSTVMVYLKDSSRLFSKQKFLALKVCLP
jgi:hypothetical protein